VTGPAIMPAASGEGRPAAFGWGPSGSHLIAVVRRPFPEPCAGQMEFF
jgi:hypothetical protein